MQHQGTPNALSDRASKDNKVPKRPAGGSDGDPRALGGRQANLIEQIRWTR